PLSAERLAYHGWSMHRCGYRPRRTLQAMRYLTGKVIPRRPFLLLGEQAWASDPGLSVRTSSLRQDTFHGTTRRSMQKQRRHSSPPRSLSGSASSALLLVSLHRYAGCPARSRYSARVALG